jgi:diacylglycerol kinase family enzyme
MFGLGRSDIVARLPDGEPYPIDLGVVTMEGIDFPFVANAVARPGRARPWGGAVAVAVGPRSCTTQAWMVTIANAQHHGRWTVAPRAALMDGAMDVQVFAGSIARRPHIQRLLRHGLHTRSKAVWRSSGTAIDATIPASWRVRTDGVAIGSGPLAARLEPGALTLWI